MSAPKGLGMWIAFWNNADRGSIESIVPRCNRSGVKWLAIRCNSGAERTRFKSLVKPLKDAGIGVYSWKYTVPGGEDIQAAIVKECLEDGADGHIINAEVEWEQEGAAFHAETLMAKIRSLVGEAWISHAPFDMPGFHSLFPYSVFNTHCDAAMPQTYWTEHGGTGAKKTLDLAAKQWAALKVQPKAYLPIGVTYGRGTPYATPARSEKMGEFKTTDLQVFLGAYPDQAVSLYSYEAADPITWELLERYENAVQLASSGMVNRLKFG